MTGWSIISGAHGHDSSVNIEFPASFDRKIVETLLKATQKSRTHTHTW